jgi:hypothetical protein
LGNRTLRECCEAYLEENPRIGKRWAETCRRNMRLHLTDLLDLPISAITAPVVRAWHAKALRGNGGRTSISQTYRQCHDRARCGEHPTLCLAPVGLSTRQRT